MSEIYISKAIIAGTRRINPSLPPRWSLVVGAIKLASLVGKRGVSGIASCAMDEKCLGSFNGAIKAVANKVLGDEENICDDMFSLRRNVSFAYPNTFSAIVACLNDEANEANVLKEGKWLNETSPDSGEVYWMEGGMAATHSPVDVEAYLETQLVFCRNHPDDSVELFVNPVKYYGIQAKQCAALWTLKKWRNWEEAVALCEILERKQYGDFYLQNNAKPDFKGWGVTDFQMETWVNKVWGF